MRAWSPCGIDAAHKRYRHISAKLDVAAVKGARRYALCSHFVILIALGLYFQITRNPGLTTVVGADVLILAALLINPYIMYMVIAVLAAAPLTLLIRGDRTGIRVQLCCVGMVVSCLPALD